MGAAEPAGGVLVREALAARGARGWQLDLVAAPLVQAMADAVVEDTAAAVDA